MSDRPDTPWLWSAGPDSDVVICSRLRLSRNLSGEPYPGRADEAARGRISTELSRAIRGLLHDQHDDYLELEPRSMPRHAQEALVEHRLLEYPLPWRLFLRGPDSFAIGTIDHLRMVTFGPGLGLEDAMARLRRLDQQLEEVVPFAVSIDFGYLSTEISNAGAAFRASTLLHLPALSKVDRVGSIVEPESGVQINAEHPPADERTKESAAQESALYVVRSSAAVDRSEDETVANLEARTRLLVHYEREARAQLLATMADELDEQAHLALDLLRKSLSLPALEAVQMLSRARFGAVLGLVDGVGVETLTSLLLLSKRHHVLNSGTAHDDESVEDRDVVRANLVRELLVEWA